MTRYTPDFVAAVRHRYEDTDQPLRLILRRVQAQPQRALQDDPGRPLDAAQRAHAQAAAGHAADGARNGAHRRADGRECRRRCGRRRSRFGAGRGRDRARAGRGFPAASDRCRANAARRRRSARRARCRSSSARCTRCASCAATRPSPRQTTMTTTTCHETSMSSVALLRDALTNLSEAGLSLAMIEQLLSLRWWRRLERDFATFAHRHQDRPQAAANGAPWLTWLMLGGRGAGKTRLGAEWVRALAHGNAALRRARLRPHRARRRDLARRARGDDRGRRPACSPARRAASGRSGSPSRRRLEWKNGAVAQVFSAEDPDSLRGPQFDAAWCDELAKWRDARSRLRHAAVRPAARRAAAPARHHHAAADRR